MNENPITEQSESKPAKRTRSAAKENKPPAGRVNAPKHPNRRNRPAQESRSKPIQSMLAPSLPQPPKSNPLGTNEQLLPPTRKTTVKNTSPLYQVIKTPVSELSCVFSYFSHSPTSHTLISLQCPQFLQLLYFRSYLLSNSHLM